MTYDRILRRVRVEIGGKEYYLRFSISVLEKIDGMLDKGLVATAITRTVLPLRVIKGAMILGLRDADRKLSPQRAEELVGQYLTEAGLVDAVGVFYVAIAVSGILGTKLTNALLDELDVANQDDEENEPEDDEKNVKAPEG